MLADHKNPVKAKTWQSKIMGAFKMTTLPARGAALALLLLAGCTDAVPYGGPGTVLSETPDAANGVLTCESLASERGAIATTLQQISGQPGTADQVASLSEREKSLAAVATSKHCPGS